MINRTRITIRLTADAADRLDVASTQTGLSRNELIHEAIDQVIARHKAGLANLNRIAQTLEFLQIAFDHVHKRDLEPVRDGIMLNVAKRMEQFHGAR